MTLRFAGYAALFDKADRGGDVIRRGAFARAVAAGPKGLPLLWQHLPGRPIGRIESLAEDARGLRVIGRLSPGASWSWLDGTDAPLAEESERYALSLSRPGGVPYAIETTAPAARIAADTLAGIGGEGALIASLTQIGTVAPSLPPATFPIPSFPIPSGD